jgi:hypothetical protein
VDTPASARATRSALLAAALEQAEWTLDQLWINYLAVGGTAGIFELESHLADLSALPSNQHDPLACALNERLADLDNPLRVPFTSHLDDDVAVRNALDVIEKLLPAGSGSSPSAVSRAQLRWHGQDCPQPG